MIKMFSSHEGNRFELTFAKFSTLIQNFQRLQSLRVAEGAKGVATDAACRRDISKHSFPPCSIDHHHTD